MKQIIFTIALFFTALVCKAQTPCDTLNAIIIYTDTTNTSNTLTNNRVFQELGYVVVECGTYTETDIEYRTLRYYDRSYTELTAFIITYKIIGQ